MKRKLTLISLLVAAAVGLVPALAKDKKHANLPEAFQTAHTVFVESREGDITDLKLDPEDRKAILDMQDAVQQWGRYTLSRSRIDADLIVVVHKGRVIRDTYNSSPLTGPRTSPAHAPIRDPIDASQGPDNNNSPDGLTREKDELRVYTIESNGKLKGPLWRDDLDRGLDTPGTLLFQRLKIDVEKAYPAAPPNKQPTP